jgi:hypothetical protein
LRHPVLEGYKYEDLALQVGGVSSETMTYDHEFFGTWSRVTVLARLRSNCTSQLQIHPFISEGAPYQETHNFQTVKEEK